MNELVDILEKESSAAKDSPQSSPEKAPNGPVQHLANGVKKEPPVTLVHKNFQVTEIIKKYLVFYLLDSIFRHLNGHKLCRAY